MQTSSSVLDQLSGRGGSGERGEEERKSRHEPFFFFYFALQLKNMWKFPGGLSEPGEDIGMYLYMSDKLENVYKSHSFTSLLCS